MAQEQRLPDGSAPAAGSAHRRPDLHAVRRRERRPDASAGRRPARRSTRLERRLLAGVLRWMGDPPVRLRLWDGETVGAGPGAAGTVVIHDPPSLRRLLTNPDLHFGEAYMRGALEVEGELVEVLTALSAAPRSAPLVDLGQRLLRPLTGRRRNSPRRARRNIHRHYDIGNDFYRLWLDEQMVYTCAYFPEPHTGLEQAQVAKMDHVARKLWLRPGDTVVEAGCGWGALALHLAREYGARVKAFNISTEQVRHARERARAEGLDERVEFIEGDYRDIEGEYDAFVSVGMLEHVGKDHYPDLGRTMARCLKPHGRALIHSIGRDRPKPMNAWIDRYIFPGAYPPTLAEMTALFEPWGLSVLDVENIRRHYARTLEHWLERFEAAGDRVRAMFDERFVRMWRLYLAGSIAGFRAGELQLFQVVAARSGANDIPWTRAYLYGGR